MNSKERRKDIRLDLSDPCFGGILSKHKVLDLFAGAGGFSLGFQQAGAHVVGATDTDEWATDTFRFNHPETHVVKEKIENLTNKRLEKEFGKFSPDIIVGGPPCQGFSICNKENGDPKDPRNSLFKDYLRAGRVFEPKLMIMENVPNLIKAKNGRGTKVIDIIQKEMEKMGYHVYWDIFEATNFGVPQIRKRLIVIASKEELLNPFPEATHSVDGSGGLKTTPTLWDAISDLPEVLPREGAEEMRYDSKPVNEYQKLLRKGAGNKVFNHMSMKHSKRMIERFESMTWGQSVTDVADHLKPLARNGGGKISKKTYDQNNRRMHPNRPCHTIAASFYANFVHPYLHRNFTAREGARIQSFPDNFVFLGKPTVVSRKLLAREGRHDENYLCQYNQIGNAVPPMMAQAIAKNIFAELDSKAQSLRFVQ